MDIYSLSWVAILTAEVGTRCCVYWKSGKWRVLTQYGGIQYVSWPCDFFFSLKHLFILRSSNFEENFKAFVHLLWWSLWYYMVAYLYWEYITVELVFPCHHLFSNQIPFHKSKCQKRSLGSWAGMGLRLRGKRMGFGIRPKVTFQFLYCVSCDDKQGAKSLWFCISFVKWGW